MKKLFIPIVIILTACSAFTARQDTNISSPLQSYKLLSDRNPIVTHTFGADPCVLVYNDRVYIYMTGDTLEYDIDGTVKTNTYGTINTLRVISSSDLVNWIYHEPIKVAGHNGIAKWAARSWAPAITYKQIDGENKFFLYFSNNANGVGVLTAASPLGPWTDPLGRALITRQTPNCSDIPWVFDPGVFIDDDGKGYLYFGGGVPAGKEANPGTARVVELNDDMISLAGDPILIDAPFFFEAANLNKIDGKYIFSYCTNWNVTDSARRELGINNAVIAIMSSNSPLGPFVFEGTIFRNPGTFFGIWGNNHQELFKFREKWYLAYHSQVLEDAMDIRGKGYRSVHIDAVTINNGRIMPITGTFKGVEQVQWLNPYNRHNGALSGNSAGLSFGSIQLTDSNELIEYADISDNGSWLGVFGVDFGGSGANSAIINVRAAQRNRRYRIDIRLGSPSGEIIGTISNSFSPVFADYNIKLSRTINGVHDVFFVFHGGALGFSRWQFFE
ncbi:MAG: glycoside hydrolase family 43 protein [Treponema sp.]|nr:glycoside hydrolase family 43 protein [Treponema sp.]